MRNIVIIWFSSMGTGGQNRNYNKQHGKKHNKGNVSYYPNGNR